MSDFTCTNDAPIVQIKQGKLKGYEFKGVYRFFGVPYARSRRFEQPQEPRAWEGIRNANAYGYICPILSNPAPSDEIGVPHRFWPENEHCQNLNVFTTTLDTNAKRAVMVWFHGGGFSAGSSIEQIAYDGDSLAKNDDVVVVTVNHRLNAFGFLDVSAFGEKFKNSGNCGVADMVASLQWVKENIDRFGGDPDNVTIFGQSGGGGKVTTLGQTAAADGLFHKGIIMSGVFDFGMFDSNRASGEEVAKRVMDELHISTIEELQKADYRLYIMAMNKVIADLYKEGKTYGWKPQEGDYFAGDPLVVGFRDHYQTIPTMVGSCMADMSMGDTTHNKLELSEEEQTKIVEAAFGKENAGKLIALYKKAYPGKPVIFAKTLDIMFMPDSGKYVRVKSAGKAPVYRYMFAPIFNYNGGRAPWHCSDIPFAFRNSEMIPYAYSCKDREKLEKEFAGAFVAFAKTGNPNHPDMPEWKASTPEDVWTMVFDDESEERDNFDDELMALNDSLTPNMDFASVRPEPEVPDDEAPGGSWAY